jgi:hypothetical protein
MVSSTPRSAFSAFTRILASALLEQSMQISITLPRQTRSGCGRYGTLFRRYRPVHRMYSPGSPFAHGDSSTRKHRLHEVFAEDTMFQILTLRP